MGLEGENSEATDWENWDRAVDVFRRCSPEEFSAAAKKYVFGLHDRSSLMGPITVKSVMLPPCYELVVVGLVSTGHQTV